MAVDEGVEDAWERYKSVNFWTIQIEEMDTTANSLFRKFTRFSRELRAMNWQIIENTRTHIDKFRRTLPLINDLKNSAMRERHWCKVKLIINQDFDENSEHFTLDVISSMQMYNFAEQIADISNAATMELAIEVVS